MGFPDFPNLFPSFYPLSHTSISSFPHTLSSFPSSPVSSPMFSLILFSQNSVLFAGNNVETTQLYIRVRQRTLTFIFFYFLHNPTTPILPI